MENHQHECLYDITRSDIPETDKFLELQRYKAKFVQLHATRREKTMLDTSQHDRIDEEQSLLHLLKMLRRRKTRAIQQVLDSHSNIATYPQDVANIFLNYLRQKFGPIDRSRKSRHLASPYATTGPRICCKSGTKFLIVLMLLRTISQSVEICEAGT